MNENNGIISSLIGKPEVQFSLTPKTIVMFFGGLFLTITAIVLVYELVKK